MYAKKTSIHFDNSVCYLCGRVIIGPPSLYGIQNSMVLKFVHQECEFIAYTDNLEVCWICDEIITPYSDSIIRHGLKISHKKCALEQIPVLRSCRECGGLLTPYNPGYTGIHDSCVGKDVPNNGHKTNVFQQDPNNKKGLI